MIPQNSGARRDEIKRFLEDKGNKFYFMGIGGISMSTLAEICIDKGLNVYGSDIAKTEVTKRLEGLGAKIFYDQCSQNVHTVLPDIAVYSLAIGEDSEELSELRLLGIPTYSRAELLGAILSEYERVISVSGSHGKSTAVSMAYAVFSAFGIEPTVMSGAEIAPHSGYISGGKKLAIAEGCEYGGSFLELHPTVQILLNLDLDHVDYYSSIEDIKSAFREAADLAEDFAVLSLDSENLLDIIPRLSGRAVTFSKNDGADYRYEIISSDGGGSEFLFYKKGGEPISFSLSVIGEHNVANAAAILTAASALGYDISLAKSALRGFNGVSRRLERIGRLGKCEIFYDYAHHPKEIGATRDALLGAGFKSIGVIFSPHTYSRTKAFFDDFARELSHFDFALLTEIYAARETDNLGVSSEILSSAVSDLGAFSEAASPERAFNIVKERSPDCLVLMGAGDLKEYKAYFEK